MSKSKQELGSQMRRIRPRQTRTGSSLYLHHMIEYEFTQWRGFCPIERTRWCQRWRVLLQCNNAFVTMLTSHSRPSEFFVSITFSIGDLMSYLEDDYFEDLMSNHYLEGEDDVGVYKGQAPNNNKRNWAKQWLWSHESFWMILFTTKNPPYNNRWLYTFNTHP